MFYQLLKRKDSLFEGQLAAGTSLCSIKRKTIACGFKQLKSLGLVGQLPL